MDSFTCFCFATIAATLFVRTLVTRIDPRRQTPSIAFLTLLQSFNHAAFFVLVILTLTHLQAQHHFLIVWCSVAAEECAFLAVAFVDCLLERRLSPLLLLLLGLLTFALEYILEIPQLWTWIPTIIYVWIGSRKPVQGRIDVLFATILAIGRIVLELWLKSPIARIWIVTGFQIAHIFLEVHLELRLPPTPTPASDKVQGDGRNKTCEGGSEVRQCIYQH